MLGTARAALTTLAPIRAHVERLRKLVRVSTSFEIYRGLLLDSLSVNLARVQRRDRAITRRETLPCFIFTVQEIMGSSQTRLQSHEGVRSRALAPVTHVALAALLPLPERGVIRCGRSDVDARVSNRDGAVCWVTRFYRRGAIFGFIFASGLHDDVKPLVVVVKIFSRSCGLISFSVLCRHRVSFGV